MDLLMTIIFTGAIWWLCAYVKNMMGDAGNIPYVMALIVQGCIIYFWFLTIKNGMLF